jgi:hypothetical protein
VKPTDGSEASLNLDRANKEKRCGLFVLVKTLNTSSVAPQELAVCEEGQQRKFYETAAMLVDGEKGRAVTFRKEA